MREYLYNIITDKNNGVVAEAIKAGLLILSLIYNLAVRALAFCYSIKPCRLECRVISVGNLTLGGTGKTSLVQLIAEFLKKSGHKAAVLSRGYKRPKKKSVLFARREHYRYEVMGDEPVMLSKNLMGVPVIVDKDRVKAGKKAIYDYGVDTVILDDGFQQWRLKKDLDIVTIDSTNPFGNFFLFPRGIMREPLSSLRRVKVIVLTKVNLNSNVEDTKRILKRVNPDALLVDAVHKPEGFYRLSGKDSELRNVDVLAGKRVNLICGIGDPDSFENLVKGLGIDVVLSFKFPDHHSYSAQDLNKVIEASTREKVNYIITTEKDSVRLPADTSESLGVEWFVLRIRLEVLQYEVFIKRIQSLY